jgi:phosphatidylglycerophosphatase A
LPALFVATGAFTGFSPWAPGTVGTLAGLLLVVITGATAPLVLSALIAGGFVIGGLAANVVARHVGHRLTPTAAKTKELFQPGEHGAPDPSIVVIDEFVGIWITLLFLPSTLPAYACAFLTFRAFDILKPPPARQLERVPGGWGIMLDDVVAGIYANIVSQIIIRFFLPSFVFLGALVVNFL